jgi:hypothetical protein
MALTHGGGAGTGVAARVLSALENDGRPDDSDVEELVRRAERLRTCSGALQSIRVSSHLRLVAIT